MEEKRGCWGGFERRRKEQGRKGRPSSTFPLRFFSFYWGMRSPSFSTFSVSSFSHTRDPRPDNTQFRVHLIFLGLIIFGIKYKINIQSLMFVSKLILIISNISNNYLIF